MVVEMYLKQHSARKRRNISLLFLAILSLQLISLSVFAVQKKSFHIDEIYSYILSNSYRTDRISHADWLWNQWIKGSDFSDFTTVQQGEQFAYDRVYYNNSLDAHPPLYYYLLHTVCSLFPGVFSKWFGLGMNIFFFALTQISLFLFSRDIFKNTLWSLIPVAVYGGTSIGLDTAIFIRMYMLMALLSVLTIHLHYKMFTRSLRPNDFLLCFLITFLGVYTQYLFAVLAFFLAFFFCIYLLYKQHWKSLFSYALSIFAAVAAVFLAYPAAFYQIIGSETNNIGNEVANNIFNFTGWGKAILSFVKQLSYGILQGPLQAKWISILVIMLCVFLAIIRREEKDDCQASGQELRVFSVGGLVLVCTSVTIAHVVGIFVYVRYLYNLVPFMALMGTLFIKLVTARLKWNASFISVGAILIWTISTVTLMLFGSNSYLYKDQYDKDAQAVNTIGNRPLVIVSNGENHLPTGNFMLLSACGDIYMTTLDKTVSVDSILTPIDCSKGVAFIILTDQYWTNGFDGDEVMSNIIEFSDVLDNYTDCGTCNFANLYIARP